jgi:hypothetical protein
MEASCHVTKMLGIVGNDGTRATIDGNLQYYVIVRIMRKGRPPDNDRNRFRYPDRAKRWFNTRRFVVNRESLPARSAFTVSDLFRTLSHHARNASRIGSFRL